MIRTIITGSAGRMGKVLVAAIAANPEFRLAGATEYPASPVIGQDAGTVAGVAALGVPISASLTDEMLANADAIIDFSTGNVLENARAAAKAGLSVVIGTTALTDADKAALRELSAQGARIVQTFNYSVGVNLLFFLSGKTAVEEMLKGTTDKMVGFECDRTNGYVCKPKLFDLADVANFEKKFPREWINAEGNNVTSDFAKYALPLIQGETKLEKEDGLPRFARLKKVFA